MSVIACPPQYYPQPSPVHYQPVPVSGYEAVLHGELTAEGTSIALCAEGTPWGVKEVAARLGRLTMALSKAQDAAGNKIPGFWTVPATWAAVVQLGFSFNSLPGYAWVAGPRLTGWTADEAARRMVPPPELPDDLYPPWLKPRDYQLDNARAIAAAGTFILMDSPGLGKTVSSILGTEARRLAGTEIFPVIIAVPSWEVADVWREHIRTWAPRWGIPRLHGGPNRVKVITGRNRHEYARDVFITTYATLRRDALPGDKGPLCTLRAATVIADEAHVVRNTRAHQTAALQRAARHASTFIAASGTFIVRDAGDAYPVLEAMDRHSFPSKERFTKRYCRTSGRDYGAEVIDGLDLAAEPELRAVLAGQMHRYAKDDVLDQLPPKIYSVRRPLIPPEWRKAYDQMEAQWLAELPGSDIELEAMDILTRFTRLSQLASSAADVAVEMRWDEVLGRDVPHQVVTLKPPSWKASSLLEILAERPDQPTAVFTESRQLAMITGQYCIDAGLRTGYVTGPGDGPGYRITQGTRKQAVQDFQSGRLDVIICTAGAGGMGITLTAANCAVMLQRSWQYDLAVQPEDRVHRIGAEIHDHVEIIDIRAQGTVDERRVEILQDKAGQAAQWAADPRIVKQLLGGLT